VAPAHDTHVDTETVGPFQENTFLLRPGDAPHTLIIDPGDEPERLIARIQGDQLVPVAILNTHAHLDHIGAVVPLIRMYDLPFYLHPADLPILKDAPEHARMFGVRVPEVPAVDFELADGDVLELAGLRITVLHTPGHTPGGVSFAVDGRLFAGDALFKGSVGRTDLPGGDWETLRDSLLNRIMTLDDETVVHSGHGPDTTVGHERRTNPFLADTT
jgi:hydroxyacylglutathione hydrolase